jgi:integrase
MNNKLAGGYNPFFEGEDARVFVHLPEVCQSFIAEKEREIRPTTMRTYTSFCKILTEWADKNAPNIYCSMFSKAHAMRFLEYVFNVRKVSATTYNNNRKQAILFFNWATEHCYTKQNPFENIKPKRKEVKKRTVIPPEVRKRIIMYLEDTKNTEFLLVCNLTYSSLLRPIEIRQIKIENVNLDGKYIVVPASVAKNHKERFAAMSEQTVSLLRRLKIENAKKSLYLVGGLLGKLKAPSERGAYDHCFQKEWERVRKALNLPAEMQLYSFRDTGIWEMLKSGIDDLSVMQHADHSDLSMTTRYANHADPNLIKKINQNVPDF